MGNRLAGETSPYLLQHASNPVDWWPWGEDAFAEARRRNVPVLLSVGYAACHWCHVMARESFADDETAALLNEHFVAVKVDREERPDVDAVYMTAVQAATGQGGWPMTVFLTPDAEPFYFGTYFPPTPRHGMPGFRQVLDGVRTAWQDRGDEVTEVAAGIAADLAGRSIAYDRPQPPGAEELGTALYGLRRELDEEHGGFGGAPKFPAPMALEFLLRHHARTGSREALEMVETTCAAMARGGIHDQLAGGFARYAVDDRWIVPHFEKMLYDNALLCRLYAHLWRTTGSKLGRRVALDTADFMVAELRTPQGGFASALDADSVDPAGGPDGPKKEGAYYVWTPSQLIEALGPEDGEFAARRFRVTTDGTFEEGASVLQRSDLGASGDAGAADDSGAADDAGTPESAERLESVRERLLAARAGRPRPERDDKVIAAWNGLAIAALAETGAYFDRPDLVEAAVAAADLLLAVHTDERGRLVRTSRDGVAGPSAGVLEDYGDLAEGLLTLYAVTGEGAWLELSGALLETVLRHFVAGDGTLYDTADDAERLIRRPQDPTDAATPSGWTAAAHALLTYAAYTGSGRHRDAAEQALGIVRSLAGRAPRFIGWGLAAAEAALDGPREVAVVGPERDPATLALHRTALLATAPGAVVAVGEPEAGPGADVGPGDGLRDSGEPDIGTSVPLLRGRPLLSGRAAAYVCRGFVCDAPTTDPSLLRRALNGPTG